MFLQLSRGTGNRHGSTSASGERLRSWLALSGAPTARSPREPWDSASRDVHAVGSPEDLCHICVSGRSPPGRKGKCLQFGVKGNDPTRSREGILLVRRRRAEQGEGGGVFGSARTPQLCSGK